MEVAFIFIIWNLIEKQKAKPQYVEKKAMFPPGIEPGTICVLGRCDNHYTTKTRCKRAIICYNLN